MRSLSIPFAAFLGIGLVLTPSRAPAYPGGTPAYVTDVAPFCASCHSSVSPEQLKGTPEDRVRAELAASKHLAKIEAARSDGPYASLSDTERRELIAGIRRIDESSSVEILAPETLKPGQVFEVTVNARGGGGPVVGLALVDATHRWQARPAASAGWQVVDAPKVTGPDGRPQSRFLEGRLPDLSPALSYVNVYGVHADPAKEEFSSVSATFRLRAPHEAGTYPLGAVFLYGTEKGSPHGAVQEIQGKRPLGGFAGASGRLRFSRLLRIAVE